MYVRGVCGSRQSGHMISGSVERQIVGDPHERVNVVVVTPKLMAQCVLSGLSCSAGASDDANCAAWREQARYDTMDTTSHKQRLRLDDYGSQSSSQPLMCHSSNLIRSSTAP